jgi:hypothetical protein
MDRLAALLGQDKLAEKIGHYLAGGGKFGLLSGPSGSGKTSVAKLVVEQWPGDVHQLSGQRKFTTIPLLAAHRALDGKRPRRSARDLERNELVDFARDIPFLGNTVAMLAKQMIARSDYQGPDFLSPDEQDLLAGFQRNSLSDSVLFVIEDLQWLDSATIDLLLKMTLPDVAAAYPFIPLSSFLLVKTTDQYEEPSTPQLRQLTAHAAGTFATTYPSRQAFPDVIRLMGLESVPDRMVCDKLHELTRGHLRLAREIVRLLQEGRISSEEVTSRREQGINQLAGSLLRIRLSDLPKESDRLERLLTIAACIGRSFTRRELQCAFKEPKAFASALDVARREEYLTGEGDALQFTHDIIQAALTPLEAENGAQYHDRLSECLRQIRPGDYRSRFRHSQQTDNLARTAELSAALLLQIDRGEETAGGDEHVLEAALGRLAPTVAAIRAARAAMDEGKPSQAISILLPFYRGTQSLLQAEIAYQLSLNYFKCRTSADYEHARAIIEPWITRREEPEVWHRLMLTLATVYSNLGERNKCLETICHVQQYIDKVAEYDKNARTKMQVLNRKAEVFYPIEMAGEFIKQAAEYFSPPAGAKLPANSFQYSAALVNLAANSYTRGEFTHAAIAAYQAIQCVSTLHRKVRTCEPYKAFNNYAIAAYRAGKISAQQARDIVSEFLSTNDLDRTLIATNAAVFSILSGDIHGGDLALDRIVSDLEDAGADKYYVVYAASNLAASQFLIGRVERALALVDLVDRHLVEAMPAELLPCFKKRQSAMRAAFGNLRDPTPETLDDYPRSVIPDGPHVAWKSIGRGFIMSDIQVWSES